MKNTDNLHTPENLELLNPLDEPICNKNIKNKDFLLNSLAKYDILIIYDKKDELPFYQDILLPTYNLYFAEDLKKAKSILDSNTNINLIIIDKKEFSKILNFVHTNSLYYTAPTVVCIDNTNHSDISLALSNDAFDVWKKPLNPDLVFYRTYNIINRHSLLDKKTGLLVRDAFISRASKTIQQNPNKTYYLIHYDIDNFKIYNHTYGLSDGDELLKYVAQKSNYLSTPDSLFCRWENDHFVALIEERFLSSKNVIRYFTQLEQAFHPEYKLYIRMGLYKITDSTLPILQMCDKALMAHKFSKKDIASLYSFYDDRVLEEQLEEQKITDEMETALKENQFTIYLQPQYNQVTMNLYGAEALVRWNHPTKGLISPGIFIPIFEKNGFILKLDRYIFKKVCELQRKWLDEGLNVVPISVNLSRAEAQNENLCDELIKILEEFHLSTKYVNLEITESAYMDNPYQVVSLTKKLQEAGFELEMDDFGSGYSSLNTLKEIPVDVLKLDLKFLYGNDHSNRTTKILSSVIRMAHGMSMPIIAEGVETKEQANFLKSLGCFYIQGFYFDKPMPSENFKERLQNHLPDISKKNRFSTEITDSTQIDIPSLLNDFVGPAGIIEYDEQTIEGVRCNNPFYELFDFSPEDYPNYQLDLETNFEKEYFEVFKNTINRAIHSKEICECDLQLAKKPNRNRPDWIRATVSYLYHHQNIYTFYVRVITIDEEKRMEKENFGLKHDIYALSDILPGGALTFEYKDNKFSLCQKNQTIATMLGYTLTEYTNAIKDDLFYFVHPDDKIQFIESLKKAFNENLPSFEYDYKLLAKSQIYLNVHCFCNISYNIDGSIYVVVARLNLPTQKSQAEYITQLENQNKELKQKLISTENELVAKDKKGSHSKKSKADINNNSFENTRMVEYKIAQENCRFATFKYSILQERFLDMSDSLPRMFGYTREEFYKKFDDSMSKFVWKQDTKATFENIQRADLENKDVCVEHRVQTKSGNLKWVRIHSRKITDDNGNEYYAGTLIDIDIERGLYKTIDSQKFTIDSLENNIEGATIRWKISGNKWITDFVSRKNEALLQCPLQELIDAWKDNPFHYAHPDDVAYIKKEAAISIKNNTAHRINFRIVRKDGSIRWLKSCGQYYPLSKNEGFFVTTCYDITEQLETENQLYDESQKLQSLVDALPGGVALYEIRPDKLKVQYVSSKVSQMFGKTKDEFINAVECNSDIGIFEKDSSRVLQAIKRLELTGEPFKVNFRVKHRNGYLVWATVNAVKTGVNNGNPTFIAVYQNKTKNTTTLDQILSKISFFVVVFDSETKELLYANPQAEIMANKHFDEFNPIHVSDFLFDKILDEFKMPVPKEFDNDEYYDTRDDKKLFVKRFRIDWNGHDAIFVMAEEV